MSNVDCSISDLTTRDACASQAHLDSSEPHILRETFCLKQTMSSLNVLVVGASIAGPMTAYWLAKAGARVTVIERFPQLRVNGQGIDIRSVGVTVMRKMPGMEEAVRAKSTSMEGISFVHEDGTPFATMRSTGDADRQSLVSEFEIFRGDLAQILYDRTKGQDDVKYIFGEQISSMQQDSETGPLKVEFTNGLETAEYDLVVACDGATSRTRAMGLTCGVRDHIRPMNCWASYFSVPGDLLNGSKLAQSYSAVNGRFLAIGPDPNGSTRIGLIKVQPQGGKGGESDTTLAFRQAVAKGDYALKSFVRETFQGSGWRCDELLQGMMASDDFYASEVVQVKVPALHKGRFVLVGDAGYGPGFTGTGTSLAMVGGYILAGEICRHRDDLSAGLVAYEKRMAPIITDLQKVPPGLMTILAPQTAWGIQLRKMLFTCVAWASSLSWLFSWASQFFSSSFAKDKYGIPDYEWVR